MAPWVRELDDDTHLVACVQRLVDGSHMGWLRRIARSKLGAPQQRGGRAEVGDDPGETADEAREADRRRGFSLDALEPARAPLELRRHPRLRPRSASHGAGAVVPCPMRAGASAHDETDADVFVAWFVQERRGRRVEVPELRRLQRLSGRELRAEAPSNVMARLGIAWRERASDDDVEPLIAFVLESEGL